MSLIVAVTIACALVVSTINALIMCIFNREISKSMYSCKYGEWSKRAHLISMLDKHKKFKPIYTEFSCIAILLGVFAYILKINNRPEILTFVFAMISIYMTVVSIVYMCVTYLKLVKISINTNQ